MKQKITKRSLHVLGVASVIALGIGSILGSGGGSSGGGTPPASTPNTNFVVFMADKDTDGVTELYKYSLETGTTDKVNGALTTNGDGGDVTSFAISPNRQWIAYVADQDTNNQFELYVAPADGSSTPSKRSGTLADPGSDVSDNPVWAPDSSMIAFHSDGAVNEQFILAVVAPTGAAGPVIVSGIGAVGANADVVADSYKWSPDSSRIAYLADLDVDDVNELYTNLTDASDNRKINSALVAGREITEYAWAPLNGARIAYRSDQTTDDEFELYTSPAAGGGNTPVGGVTGVPGADVVAGSIVWAPDDSRVAFIADRTTDELFELNTNLPAGGGLVTVSDGITGQKDVVGTPSWAPNSSRVAYLADRNQNDVFELFTSLPTAAGSTRVNEDLAGGNVSTGPTQAAPPAWSPDSSKLIYAAEQDSAGVMEVYIRAADGTGTSTRVSGTPMAGDATLSGDAESWSPNGNQILYRADQLVAGTNELWTSTSGGASNTILTRSPPAVTTALKSFGKWAPDSSYVAYASTQDTGTAVVELFISTPGGTITNVSGTIAGSAGVNPSTFAWGP